MTISLSKFINNIAQHMVYIPFYSTVENLTNNVFIDNIAVYDVFVNSDCRQGTGLGLSLGMQSSLHSMPCPVASTSDGNCDSGFYSWYNFSHLYVSPRST